MRTRIATVAAVITMTVLTGCSGNDTKTDTPEPSGSTNPLITEAQKVKVPAQWKDGWCQLRTGMNAAEVVDLMGKPTSKYGDQWVWEAGVIGLALTMKNDSAHDFVFSPFGASKDAAKPFDHCKRQTPAR